MRYSLVALLLLSLTSYSFIQPVRARDNHDQRSDESVLPLLQKKWIHGSADCKLNADPAIEVYRYDDSSYILRQNKCLSFEAPFIYLLIGTEKALVLDTGATESSFDFPLYETVQSLLDEQARQDGKTDRDILVIHSHSHGDHTAGDTQFEGNLKVILVAPNKTSMRQFFAFDNWPQGEAIIDLGERRLVIIPTPGHQEEAIAVYDPQTKWLLTGDTFYPGYIYVKNWSDYKNSITALVALSKLHTVDAILGAHIEMTKQAGEVYPIGTIYQPDEAALSLQLENLIALNSELEKSDKRKKIIFDEFIVAPMNVFQRTISNIARKLIQ